MVLIDTSHVRAGCVWMPSSCVASGNVMMPWPRTVTPEVALARMSSHFLSLPSSAMSHHVRHYSASLHKCRARVTGVPASDSMSYSHCHNLYGVAEVVATVASASGTIVSKVVGIGMIRTEAGLNMQNAAMEVRWYDLLPSTHQSPSSPIPSHGIYQLDIDRRAAHP